MSAEEIEEFIDSVKADESSMYVEGGFEELHTSDEHGVQYRFFILIRSESGGGVTVRVYENPTPRFADEFYEAGFVPLGDDCLQVDMLDNHKQEWAMRKGISEAVFREVHRATGATLVSSRPCVESSSERQTEAAKRMWRRFVAAGRAVRLEEEDRWQYVPE